MSAFDKDVFELMIEKVIIGEKETNGNINPRVITFILKSGNEIKCEENKNQDNLQQSTYEGGKNYLQSGCELCGVRGSVMSKGYDIIAEFTAFENFIIFDRKGKKKVKRKKIIKLK